MKDPAFLFYFQDFLVGTSFMTLEEIGAYIKILCFQADRGPLREQDILKKIPAPIWNAICCKFKKDKDTYFNARLQEEVAKRKNYTESRRKNLHMGKHMKPHMNKHMENVNEDVNKDINRIKDSKDKGSVDLIVTDLNCVLGTNYKTTSTKTADLISYRINDGFTVEDFKKVHRNMLFAWGADSKMVKYLRPETLYGTKFESYLNQKTSTTKLTSQGVGAYLVGQTWLKEKGISNAG